MQSVIGRRFLSTACQRRMLLPSQNNIMKQSYPMIFGNIHFAAHAANFSDAANHQQHEQEASDNSHKAQGGTEEKKDKTRCYIQKYKIIQLTTKNLQQNFFFQK